MNSVLIINGPNLNMLGLREPNIYGNMTLSKLNTNLVIFSKQLEIKLSFFQSNSESELIDKTQAATEGFLIINPAAFTHTSIAWRDALLIINKPFIEVHISNIFKREQYRQNSFFSDIALGTITGLGTYGYELALHYANSFFKRI